MNMVCANIPLLSTISINRFAFSLWLAIIREHSQVRNSCIHSSIGRVAVFETVGCRFEPYWVHHKVLDENLPQKFSLSRSFVFQKFCPGGGMVDTYAWGAYAFGCVGSSPILGTRRNNYPFRKRGIFLYCFSPYFFIMHKLHDTMAEWSIARACKALKPSVQIRLVSPYNF